MGASNGPPNTGSSNGPQVLQPYHV